ncbi:Protein of unknown function [Bacillus mycoides]|nr:Protein of unknown function [Bacillus mycoides]
MTAIWSAVSEV